MLSGLRGSDAGRDTPVSWAARQGEEEAWKQHPGPLGAQIPGETGPGSEG